MRTNKNMWLILLLFISKKIDVLTLTLAVIFQQISRIKVLTIKDISMLIRSNFRGLRPCLTEKQDPRRLESLIFWEGERKEWEDNGNLYDRVKGDENDSREA